jgi:hypothetical protein
VVVARSPQMRASAGRSVAEGRHVLQPIVHGGEQQPRCSAALMQLRLPRNGAPPSSASPADALGNRVLQPAGGRPPPSVAEQAPSPGHHSWGSRVAVMAAHDDGGGVGDEVTTNVAAEVATAAREPKRCWHMILNCGHVTSRSSRSSRQNHVCAWPMR